MTAVGPRRLALKVLPPAWAHVDLVRATARAIELGARLGYVARGAVYLSVGAMALLAAAGLTPRAKGALEALYAWGRWPPGLVLLWVTGVGLYAFAAWRALQALADADRLGRTPAALATRAGKAISGLVHAGLAISVFGVLDAIEDLREVDDQAATRLALETVLARPGGGGLVVLAGLAIAAVGVANVVRAAGDHFTEDLECGETPARWTGVLARVGYVARGLAIAGAGGLIALAGFHARASDASGLGGALEALKAQPGGPVWLGLMGAGLIAFAAFAICKAGLRRIGC